MKQIKGIILFLMSIVLVAFGSQDSKSSKNLVKQLEDETKKVGDKIKDVNKTEKTAKVETKKDEPKQVAQNSVPQQQPVAVKPAQPQAVPQQQPAPNTVAQNPQANPEFALNETGANDKKETKKTRRSSKSSTYKAPKHSRLKESSDTTEKFSN